MRWPFRGSTLDEYLALFNECVDVPIDERESLVAEVRSHLEEATERIAGPRHEAEVQATQTLGSPRELAARISKARRHGRSTRIFLIESPLNHVKYEVSGEALRAKRRDIALLIGLFAYPVANYWFTIAIPHRGVAFVLAVASCVLVVAVGRWALARLTPAEVSRVLLGGAGVLIVCCAIASGLYLAGVVQDGLTTLLMMPVFAALALGARAAYRHAHKREVALYAQEPEGAS